MYSRFILFLLILYFKEGESIRFGNELSDKTVDNNFETMGDVGIEQFSMVNDITTLEVVVEDTIGIDELWVLDFQPLNYHGQLPIILINGSLRSSRTGTCSSIFRDADWDDDYFDDEYFISSTESGEKDLYNSFVRGNVTENNQRKNKITFNGDLSTLLNCQEKDGTNAWHFDIFDEEIQYQSLLYASNVRPILPNWSPELGTKLQLAYVQTHFRLFWRLSRYAILNFITFGDARITDRVGLITVFFDFGIVDAVYENGSPNPAKTYLTMGISTRITNGESIMLSFKNNSIEYVPRTKGNAIDVIHQFVSCELLDIDPWYLSADVTLQTVFTVVDEEQEQITLNVIQLSNDKGEDLRGGTGVKHEENITLAVNFSPAYLRDNYILEMSLFMVCIGEDNSESTRGCLAADEDDRYTGFVSSSFELDYDPVTDPVVIKSQAASENKDGEIYDDAESSQADDEIYHEDEDGFQWTLVMKATAGISQRSVYDTWVNEGGLNEMDPNAQVLDTSFAGHYKNSIVDNWNILQVRTVKVALYTSEEEVMFLTFDADGSNAENWFSQDRILDSSFSDLKSGIFFNFFSISGHSRADLHRRWFINKSYGGCNNDRGWFVVVDGRGPCAWENSAGDSPQFLYAPKRTHHRWQIGSSQSADIFAIFIEHLYFPVETLTTTNFVHTQETPNLYSFIRSPPAGGTRGDTLQSKNFNLLETKDEFLSTPYFIMVRNSASVIPVIITNDPNDVLDHFILNSTFYAGNVQDTSNTIFRTFYSAFSMNSNNLISYLGETDPLMLTCSSFVNVHDPRQYMMEYTALWIDISRQQLAYFLRFRNLNAFLLNICNYILIQDINVDDLQSYSLEELKEVIVDKKTVFELLASLQYFTEMNLLHDDLYTVLNITKSAPVIDSESGAYSCQSEVVDDIMYVMVVTQEEDLLNFIDPFENLNLAMNFIYNLIDTTGILLPTAVFETYKRHVLTSTNNGTRLTVKQFVSYLNEYLASSNPVSVPNLSEFEEQFYRSFVDIILGRNTTLHGQKLVPHPFKTDEPEYISGMFRQGYIESCHINWHKVIEFSMYSDPHYQYISAYKGGWDVWGEWSLCSSSCGEGVRIRTRKCIDSINECSGEPSRSEPCNTMRCDIYINNHNFATQVTFINSTMTFVEAEEYCNAIGGHLPDVNDIHLKTFIMSHMTTYVGSVVYVVEFGECKLLRTDGYVDVNANCSAKFTFFCQSDYVSVFKVEAGSGVDVYDLWTSDGSLDDTLDSKAYRILSTETFKSHFVEEWESGILIEEVKIMLLDNDFKSVWQMTFNGSMTDKIDWFSEDHVITSQYNNFLGTRKTFFSIKGNKRAKRRFFINHNYQGCQLDSGWLQVIDDAEGYCSWEDKFTSSPQFIYSGGTSHEIWAENDNYARMFVISLKFRNEPALPRKRTSGPVAQKYSIKSITPPTPDQQINFEEYDFEQSLHQSEFTNRALSGEKADYTLTAVYTLISKEKRRKREDDVRYDGRHRRSLTNSVKKPQIRTMAFSFHGCPEGSAFNPLDRSCDCIADSHVIHHEPYKCLKPDMTTDNNNNNNIILKDDYNNFSTKVTLDFSLFFICFCLITSYLVK
ncbi:uncharacterized protein LOC117121719 [Anneissia japonica]|uniref:uncharacterized protein LOC117121719 n=1 Tax=Anneissia japonica TaxID=1529436 RepID=UPI001425A1D3|nr:uncharacterized protein LOC117121719 [Anneissia japonica]